MKTVYIVTLDYSISTDEGCYVTSGTQIVRIHSEKRDAEFFIKKWNPIIKKEGERRIREMLYFACFDYIDNGHSFYLSLREMEVY